MRGAPVKKRRISDAAATVEVSAGTDFSSVMCGKSARAASTGPAMADSVPNNATRTTIHLLRPNLIQPLPSSCDDRKYTIGGASCLYLTGVPPGCFVESPWRFWGKDVAESTPPPDSGSK